MDTKAMAKSKRAHSQQHHSSKRSHPNQTTATTATKSPSDGTSSSSSSSGLKNAKKQQQQPHKSRGGGGGLSSLPANWDRYEEEEKEGEHDSESSRDGGGTGKYSDVVKPKSKGADYRHLISEAQSQLDTQFDCLASLADFLPDFNQGIGSVLSVRGEGIVWSTRDDNFIVDDKSTSSYEAPFLSLNLHTLAEKLAKVDLSKRLFIEADLLPPDLCAEESEAGNEQESDHMTKTRQSKTTTRISDKVYSRGFSEKDKVAELNSEVTSTGHTGSNHPVSTSSDLGSKSIYRGKDDVEQFDGAGPNISLGLAFSDKKLPAFEAASAEAELDMLLDSLNETKFLDDSGSKEKSTNSIPGLQDSRMASPQLLRRAQDSSKTTSTTANFDDTIDNLLGTTSSLISQNHALQPQSLKAPSLDDSIDDLLGETSSLMNRKATLQPKGVKVLSLDDSIDDLLAETSNLTSQSGPSQTQIVKAHSPENNSSTSSRSDPKLKMLSDFDSWLDTI